MDSAIFFMQNSVSARKLVICGFSVAMLLRKNGI